jgi:hypothetical protein
MREHIRRFGQYVLDMDDLPKPSTYSRSRSSSPCDHFYAYPEFTPSWLAWLHQMPAAKLTLPPRPMGAFTGID